MKNIEKYFDELRAAAIKYGTIDCTFYHLRENTDDCNWSNCAECCVKSLEWLNEEEEK